MQALVWSAEGVPAAEPLSIHRNVSVLELGEESMDGWVLHASHAESAQTCLERKFCNWRFKGPGAVS